MYSTDKNKNFGFLFALIFLLIGIFQLVRSSHFVFFMMAGFMFFTMALLKPLFLQPFRKLWEQFGFILGFINTYIVLILIYFLFFMPFGLIIRLLRKDPLKKRIVLKSESYWEVTSGDPQNHLNFQF